MKHIKGNHTCCECGQEYEWRMYFLDKHEVVVGRWEDLVKNVVNQYKDGNSYTLTIQCPYCHKRHTLSGSIRSAE